MKERTVGLAGFAVLIGYAALICYFVKAVWEVFKMPPKPLFFFMAMHPWMLRTYFHFYFLYVNHPHQFAWQVFYCFVIFCGALLVIHDWMKTLKKGAPGIKAKLAQMNKEQAECNAWWRQRWAGVPLPASEKKLLTWSVGLSIAIFLSGLVLICVRG